MRDALQQRDMFKQWRLWFVFYERVGRGEKRLVTGESCIHANRQIFHNHCRCFHCAFLQLLFCPFPFLCFITGSFIMPLLGMVHPLHWLPYTAFWACLNTSCNLCLNIWWEKRIGLDPILAIPLLLQQGLPPPPARTHTLHTTHRHVTWAPDSQEWIFSKLEVSKKEEINASPPFLHKHKTFNRQTVTNRPYDGLVSAQDFQFCELFLIHGYGSHAQRLCCRLSLFFCIPACTPFYLLL